jgi:hypothetical protein
MRASASMMQAYLPRISSMNEPEIPGSGMALIAKKPHRKINHAAEEQQAEDAMDGLRQVRL